MHIGQLANEANNSIENKMRTSIIEVVKNENSLHVFTEIRIKRRFVSPVSNDCRGNSTQMVQGEYIHMFVSICGFN